MATSTQSIREIVSTQSSAAAVLQRFDIDLCSHADEPLKEACAELQLSVDQVLEKLADAASSEQGAVIADFSNYSLGRLIQHIVRTHHQYVRRELPRMSEMAQKVAGKHGNRVPEMKRIGELVMELSSEMFAHFEKEEQILFPFITGMEQGLSVSCAPFHACFESLARPVAMMVMEHGMAESRMAEIHDMTNGFAPPDWACPTFNAFYAGLKEFAANLREHVSLENDILFPRAIKLEAKLACSRGE